MKRIVCFHLASVSKARPRLLWIKEEKCGFFQFSILQIRSHLSVEWT